jgi:hypothetical protein
MTSLVDPRAAARIKAAFDTCELVVQAVQTRRARLGKVTPKAAPTRTTMIYERGTVRIVTDRG